MQSSRYKQCDQPLVGIDHWSERITGCPTCNRWQASTGEWCRLAPDDIVARHVAGQYRVAMIGFTPGWSYLSGLEKFLHMPRRENPRLQTPAGTISVGGVQTGIQCLAGPSGWHLLGRTPVRTYQLHRDPTFLLEPGDHVTFFAIDAKTFAEQDRAAEAGEIIAELIAA